jgi:hypothetical protein
MKTVIESFHAFGDQRIEVKLSNGQELTLFVDSETGKVSILAYNPHLVGELHTVVHTEGRYKGLNFSKVMAEVNHYGYPSD